MRGFPFENNYLIFIKESSFVDITKELNYFLEENAFCYDCGKKFKSLEFPCCEFSHKDTKAKKILPIINVLYAQTWSRDKTFEKFIGILCIEKSLCSIFCDLFDKYYHKKYNKIKNKIRSDRKNEFKVSYNKNKIINKLLELQEDKCYYCGEIFCDSVNMNLDHIESLTRGGPDNPSNLVLSCERCNKSKYKYGEEEYWVNLKKVFHKTKYEELRNRAAVIKREIEKIYSR